jgi:penicillin amidase
MRVALALIPCALVACKPTASTDPFDALAVERTVPLAGLQAPAEVVFTELGVPHVYAADLTDAARVQGYLYARDRLFTLDLARRLALGEIAGLLGELGLPIDIDSRLIGMTRVAEQLLAASTPEQLERLQAYADGVNAAIADMKTGALPLPSELDLAGPLLGADDPSTLLEPFELRDMGGVLATLMYQLAFSREDLDNEAALAALAALPDDVAFGAQRREAALRDLYGDVRPIHPRLGAPDWATSSDAAPSPTAAPSRPVGSLPLLDELRRRLDRLGGLAGASRSDARGSNAWAVHADQAGGRALLAGDGHLPLTVPSLFWQIGVDTVVLGGGEDALLGLGLLGLPGLAVGTNGHVAWSQTRLMGDVVDWYDEELQLDPVTGAPAASRFDGGWRPLVAVAEQSVVAEVMALGSEGTTLSWTRYTTFDGRLLVTIEGEAVEGALAPGDVRQPDGWIRPADVDEDGAVRAISMDYTALDPSGVLSALEGFSAARDVRAFREATRFLNGYGQNIVAADRHGDVLYTSYQAMPCREALPREGGVPAGADPTRVLDGTRFPGFTIPLTEAGEVDHEDPEACVVPFDDHPWEISPARGWVMSANQDPGGWSLDGDLFDDTWYMGGPWSSGHRAERIAVLLDEVAGEADADAMRRIQADAVAADAGLLLPFLLAALDEAEAGAADAQATAAWEADAVRLTEARDRLRGWSEGGFLAASGVQTPYHTPAPGEAEDAVATMIYYAWQSAFVAAVFDDEGLPDELWRPYPSTGIPRALLRLLRGRGPGDLEGLHSWRPETGESVFFDLLGTEEVETSEAVLIGALSAGLDELSGPTGFDTAQMDAWRWGLRHVVRFESILADVLGDQPLFAPLTRAFAITTEVLPLGEDLPLGDPRRDLEGFPRPGASGSVDEAGYGFSTSDFSYTDGPAFRMVFSLGPDGVEGYNVLPGGQSALTTSPHFADQAAQWLGNEAIRVRYTVEEVVAGAEERWRFEP